MEEKQPDAFKNKFTTNHTSYFIYGIVSICLSVFSLFKGLNRVSDSNFTNYAEWNDLMQANLALPAFLASLGGIFFVVDNLKLQRNTLLVQIEANNMQYEELKLQILESKESNEHFKKQNETLLNQQADNTFFNLINLNKEVNYQLAENNFFTDSKNNIIRQYKPYAIGISENSFASLSETIYDPEFYFSTRESEGTTKFRTFATNSKDIIDFIEERLCSQGSFYHKLFYNLLSSQEKFFLGFFVEFELFGLKNPSSFDYSAYYKTQLEYTSKFKRFPALKADLTTRNCKLVDLNETDISLNINTINYNPVEPVVLSNVSISVKLQNNDSLVNRKVECSNIELRNSYNISIKDEIQFIKELNKTQTLDIVFTWHLKYKEEIFTTNSRIRTHYIINDKITFVPVN